VFDDSHCVLVWVDACDRPRTNRTTATKISASLISKIENNESGCDLKITALIPFDHLSQLCQALSTNESTERLDLEGCGAFNFWMESERERERER